MKIPVIVLRCLGILIMYIYRNPAIFLFIQVLGKTEIKFIFQLLQRDKFAGWNNYIGWKNSPNSIIMYLGWKISPTSIIEQDGII